MTLLAPLVSQGGYSVEPGQCGQQPKADSPASLLAGVFHDEYERVNFWSHAVPGVLFLLLGALALRGLVPGALPLFVYTCCTGTTHLTSAATHVYPDSHLLVSLHVPGREPCVCPAGDRSGACPVSCVHSTKDTMRCSVATRRIHSTAEGRRGGAMFSHGCTVTSSAYRVLPLCWCRRR